MQFPAMTPERSRQLLIVISVAFSSFMARLNNYIVNVSLPTISRHFDIGTSEVSRVVMAYLLVITSSLMLFGRLGDRIGLKKIFTVGYIVFIGGSLLCGIAWSIDALVAFRCIQGVGSAMLLATGYAIISKHLPANRTGWAFGITSTSSALGVATGAPLGGLITGYLSWHWIFIVSIPVCIVAIIFAIRGIPDDRPEERSVGSKEDGFDIPGSILSFVGLSSLVYTFNMGKAMGWLSLPIIASFCISAASLLLFVVREKRSSSPLLDLGLFNNLSFSFALIATFMAFMLIAGNAFLLPFYLEIIKGLDAKQTGMVLLVYSLVYVFLSPYAGRLSDKVNPVTLCTIAMVSAAVNTFVFSFTLGFNGFLFVFIFLIWLGLSYVLFFSPNNNQVMSLAPAGKQGIASGLFNTTTNLSMVFGVCLFEMVFSYHIPESSPKSINIFQAKIPQSILLDGFHNTYILGGIVCTAALFFSLLTRIKR